jgi:thiosulfate/3-mercaptopyruvate sulfurtransferase
MCVDTQVASLVETDWLAEHLHDPDVRVVEVDVSPAAYATGHVEGAVLWNVYADLLQPTYRIVEQEAFAALLGRSGFLPGSHVVVYGYAAAMAFWMLTYYGHPRVSLVDGSRGTWIQDGRPLSTVAPSLAPTTYPVAELDAPQAGIRATRELVARAIGDPNRRLMDVRSEAEYIGERFWPSLPPKGDERGGHVPGAILVPIEETWAADGRFKDPSELRERLRSKGLTPDKEIIT